jgi:hypothetical protein
MSNAEKCLGAVPSTACQEKRTTSTEKDKDDEASILWFVFYKNDDVSINPSHVRNLNENHKSNLWSIMGL